MLLSVNFTEQPSIISCKWDKDLVPGMGRTCESTFKSQAIARPDAIPVAMPDVAVMALVVSLLGAENPSCDVPVASTLCSPCS